MKIRELNIIGVADLNKLGKYAEMSVEEYVEWIKQQKKSRQHINKFYQSLYDKICDGLPGISISIRETPKTKKAIQLKLKEISLDEIQYYVDGTEYTKHCGELRRNGITNLGQLYSFQFLSKCKFEIVAQSWQQILKEKHTIIISNWEDYHTTKVFPTEIKKEDGLIDNLKRAIWEIASSLASRIGNKKYPQTLKYNTAPEATFPLSLVSSILLLYYGENRTEDEIKDIHCLTKWRVQDVHLKTITAIVAGETISENLRLNKDIVEWICTVKKECLFHTEDELIKITGKNDEQMFHLLGYDFVEVEGVRFVIPKDTKGIYSKVGNTVISTLRENALPTEKEEIIEKAENHKKMSKVDKNYDDEFINRILSCEKLIETKANGKIALRTEYLSSDEQRIARIIYESEKPVSKSEVYKRFEAVYCRSTTFVNFSTLSKYGLSNVQGNLWYHGKELKPIQSFISDYAENQKIFFYSDLESKLKFHGYIIPSSIRTYITNVCQVDNNDRLHFCHKDWIEDFPQFSWRNQNRDGVTNWILNQIKDYLSNKESVDVIELYDYVEEKAKGTDYEKDIRQRVQYTVVSYSGEVSPFLLYGNNLRKNVTLYDTFDFSVLGLKGSKYPFFIQIRSIVLNEIKKSKDGRISLVDAVKLVNESIEEPQSRNTVIRAITNKHLPSINAEIKNIGGTLYIVRVGAEIAAEPVYEIKPSVNVGEAEVVQDIKVTEERPSITYRLTLDWSRLEPAMKRELTFYKNWMCYEHIDFEEAIRKFVMFIKNAENDNLKRKLPQNLYEYWFASTDYFDRNMYVSNLALFYEGLLSEIKYQKDGIRLHKKGLGDWALEFPTMARNMGLPTRMAKGFDRIFCDLYSKRNKFAHGEPVEMSSSDTAKTISDYIALYIFTVAKYS